MEKGGKSQESHDFIHVGYKTESNKRETNKVIDMDHRMVITKGKEDSESKKGRISGDR